MVGRRRLEAVRVTLLGCGFSFTHGVRYVRAVKVDMWSTIFIKGSSGSLSMGPLQALLGGICMCSVPCLAWP